MTNLWFSYCPAPTLLLNVPVQMFVSATLGASVEVVVQSVRENVPETTTVSPLAGLKFPSARCTPMFT